MIARDNLGYRQPVLDGLDSWCARWLGSRPVQRLFTAGHLARVAGLVLADGRRVVVKVRPAAQRLHGCVAFQRYASAAGFPCPRPLTGIAPFADGELVAHAETEEFLDAYQRAAGRRFSVDEERQAWAAGLWTRAFNAKKWLRDGIEVLTADEAAERMRRAVVEPHFM